MQSIIVHRKFLSYVHFICHTLMQFMLMMTMNFFLYSKSLTFTLTFWNFIGVRVNIEKFISFYSSRFVILYKKKQTKNTSDNTLFCQY